MRIKKIKSLIGFILMVIITCAYVTLKDFNFNKILNHKSETKQTTAQKQVASNTKTTDLGYFRSNINCLWNHHLQNGRKIS